LNRRAHAAAALPRGVLALLLTGCTGLGPPDRPLNPLAPDDRGIPVVEVTDPSLTQPIPLATDQKRLDRFTSDNHLGEDWQGFATVDFIIDEKGVPRGVQTIYASEPDFGAAAAATVAHWRFTPGSVQGRLVRVHLQAPLTSGNTPGYSSPYQDAGAPGSPAGSTSHSMTPH
jgi:TonB family protein